MTGVNRKNRHTHKPTPGYAVELSRIKLFHTVKLMTKVPEYFPFDETRTQITSELLYLRMMPKSVYCKNVKMTTIIQSTITL